jgi:hypothetical protein
VQRLFVLFVSWEKGGDGATELGIAEGGARYVFTFAMWVALIDDSEVQSTPSAVKQVTETGGDSVFRAVFGPGGMGLYLGFGDALGSTSNGYTGDPLPFNPRVYG